MTASADQHAANDVSTISWAEGELTHASRWQSESGIKPPKRLLPVDDTLNADTAFRLASEGTGLLWRGDYQNARQLLQAITRRLERKPRKTSDDPREAFNLHRQAQAQRARTLGMLLMEVDADHNLALRRAPAIRDACLEAYGVVDTPYIVSLREILGLIGAHEWHRKGVEIAALGARIHPCYGVFSPVRGEYLSLIDKAPLPSTALAFDIGTGTGVIAALLAKRGVCKVVATDCDARALACARENIERLQYTDRVEIVEADLFPAGRAPLIVCNPPWLPARPSAAIEHAIYDPDNRMLRGFLDGLAAHLEPQGEGWLILSDLAEHLQLRSRQTLQDMIAAAGLKVIDRLDTRPAHGRAMDTSDPLHAARSREVTSLWRLGIV